MTFESIPNADSPLTRRPNGPRRGSYPKLEEEL